MRRLLLAVAAVLALSAPAAAQTVVQTANGTRVNGTFTLDIGANVTTGNAVICSTVQTSGAGSTFTISDATNGTYDIAISEVGGSGGLDLNIMHKRNITGGFDQITITTTDATTDFDWACFEVSGLDNSVGILTDNRVQVTATTSHACGASGVTGTGFALCAAQMGASVTFTETASWTQITPEPNGQLIQRHIATFASDTAAFTVSSSTSARSVIALFRVPSAGGGCSGLFCDAFDRANNTDLGANWDATYTVGNALEIVGEQIRATVVNTRSLESVNAVSLANNQRARVTIATITGAQEAVAFVILRAAAPTTSTFYRFAAHINNTTPLTSRIDRFVAGAQTVITSENATTWAAGDILEAEATDTTLRLYRIVGASSVLVLETTDENIASGRAGAGAFVATGGSLANSEIEDFMATDATAGGGGRAMMMGIGR